VARLIYLPIASLDGFAADEDGNFDWAAPDDEVHGFVNDLARPVGTWLLGRRMYDVLQVWETWDTTGEPDAVKDFAGIWHGADKVVYSTTLDAPVTARTRIERRFDPDAIREMKAKASADMSVAGPELAGQALAAGLVDECHLLLSPIIVGAGTPCLPRGVRIGLELLGERRFGNGVVHLHYRVAT